jgi:hypothetical protein
MRLGSFNLLHIAGICALGLVALFSCTLHG